MKAFTLPLSRAAVAASLLAAAAAQAAPPANIANTTWSLRVNRDAAVVLYIDTQAGSGAPGQAVCRAIQGYLSGNQHIDVRGWYCPSTGRIQLLHEALNSEIVMRVFTGNVSDDGTRLYMAGTASILASAFGDLGEKNFNATEQ